MLIVASDSARTWVSAFRSIPDIDASDTERADYLRPAIPQEAAACFNSIRSGAAFPSCGRTVPSRPVTVPMSREIAREQTTA
jgi:hypothetical protein